jgi:acyl-CoA reductase-like NAD-dependent aldehyde dehydrogenase
VPKCTQEEMNEAVAAAQHAYKEWKDTTPLTRQRKMLDLQLLIRDNSVSSIYSFILNLFFFILVALTFPL